VSSGSPGSDPHRATIEVYERRAAEWETERTARVDEAQAFTDRLRRDPDVPPGAVVDLGCGPGWHLPALPEGTIAVDAAGAMLELVPEHRAGAPRVAADLRALPFRRHSLRAAWVNKSYVHLDRRLTPLALWDLHRSLSVGGLAHLGVFAASRPEAGPEAPESGRAPTGGPSESSGSGVDLAEWEGDDFAGRSFSHWTPALLDTVIAGAGFSVLERVERPESEQVTFVGVTLRRERTLADTVGPGMRLLLVGLNPSEYAADVGVGFARPGNRAWPALLASGLASTDRDPVALLRSGRVGMSDLVKRATPRADRLHRDEFASGLERLDRLCEWLRPGAVCILGVTGWRQATGDRAAVPGPQEQRLGGRPVHVAPNPSGLNAHTSVDDLVDHLHAALALAVRA
jgi:TDG/mug DNA glycosylase family protein